MPYSRQVLLQGDAIACEQLTLLQAAPRWSDEYQVDGSRLVLTLQGPMACRVDGQEWRCDPAVGLWLSPEQPYRMQRPLAGQDSLVVALVGVPVRAGRVSVAPAAWLALRRWRTRARSADALAAEESLLAAIAPLTAASQTAWRQERPAVERALAFLAVHFDRNDTLADIGRAVASSPFHLARQFRRVTGFSLHAHRTRLRVAEALRRLEDGADDLSALALELGFSSHSHFTQVFRASCAATPRQVRTNLAALSRRKGDTARPWSLPSSASSRALHRP